MLKLLGGVLVLGGCLLWGVRAADELSKRVRVLEELIGAVRVFERELALFQPAVPELLSRMARGQKGQVFVFLNSCRAGIEKGKCFIDVWGEGVDKLPLQHREKELLRGLGQVLGRYDDRGQVQVAERIRGELEECAARARQSSRVRGRLYRTLGATAGGFLLLTLI